MNAGTVVDLPAGQIMEPGAAAHNRTAWLLMRRTGIGSSDVSAILGRQTGDFARCARDVWEDKTGRLPLDDDNSGEAARWGTLLEPVVRDEWSRRSGIAVTETGMHRSRTHPFMIADVDGLTADGGIYEGKTAHDRKADQWDDGIPEHAFWQVQHGMAVMGRPHAWVAALVGGQRPFFRKIERDEQLIADMIEAERKFWGYVQFDAPPPLDGSPAAADWIARHYPLAVAEKTVEVPAETAELIQRAYAAVKTNAATTKENETQAKNIGRELMGDAEVALCDGRVVATWKNTGEFNHAAFRAAHPELAAEFEVPVPALDTAALARAHPDLFRQFRGRTLLIKKSK